MLIRIRKPKRIRRSDKPYIHLKAALPLAQVFRQEASMLKQIKNKKNPSKKQLLNQRGQGLIEYLILVALIAVGTISVVKVFGKTITAQYAELNNAMGGSAAGPIQKGKVSKKALSQKDMSNFAD
jgi:pilus assembly protein Flp/PilA